MRSSAKPIDSAGASGRRVPAEPRSSCARDAARTGRGQRLAAPGRSTAPTAGARRGAAPAARGQDPSACARCAASGSATRTLAGRAPDRAAKDSANSLRTPSDTLLAERSDLGWSSGSSRGAVSGAVAEAVDLDLCRSSAEQSLEQSYLRVYKSGAVVEQSLEQSGRERLDSSGRVFAQGQAKPREPLVEQSLGGTSPRCRGHEEEGMKKPPLEEFERGLLPCRGVTTRRGP